MKTKKLKGFKTKSLQSLQASLTLLSTLHVNTTSTKSVSVHLSKLISMLVHGSTPAPENNCLLGAFTGKIIKSDQENQREKLSWGELRHDTHRGRFVWKVIYKHEHVCRSIFWGQMTQLLMPARQPLHREQNCQLSQVSIHLVQKKNCSPKNLPLQHIFLQKATTLDLV